MRTATVHHESELGRWTLLRRRPPRRLAPYVVELQAYSEREATALVRTEIPGCTVPMIVILDGGFAACGEGARPLDRSFVAGLHTRPAFVASTGRADCLQVDFTPEGARRFLRDDLAGLAGRVVDLAALSPRLDADLSLALGGLPDWERRLDALEAMLEERILGAPDDPLLARAADLVVASAGAVPIGTLAETLQISRAGLHRAFRTRLGMAPKTFARVTRFAEAARRLTAPERGFASLADLAVWCGYADQSHFNRDFAAFAGMPPGAMRARALPDGTGLIGG